MLAPLKRRAAGLLARARHVWTYGLRWPVPLWRLRGYGWIRLGGQRLRFERLHEWPTTWWARRANAGAWEPEVIAFLEEHVRPGDVVIDIGAYVGPHALLASRLAGAAGHVYAFEPDPIAREQLERNVEANGASNVTVVAAAVTDREGTVQLAASGLGNANTRVGDDGTLAVPAVTLASFCRQHRLRPAVVKMDVEGGEAEIVAAESLAILREARAVVIEVHEPALRAKGVDPDAFLARCASLGKPVRTLEERVAGNFNVGLA